MTTDPGNPTTRGRANEIRVSGEVLAEVAKMEALSTALQEAIEQVRREHPKAFSGSQLLKYGYLWDAFVHAARRAGVTLTTIEAREPKL
jgi:hypothetical protein